MDIIQGKNILVVDDEPGIVEIIKAYLEKSGAKVFPAFYGKEGLSLFETQKIDLVVLDLMIPDIQGEEICRRIREKSNVPIIMVTAKAEEADELAGLGIGADDYITKPFSCKILIARIAGLLRRAEAASFKMFSDGNLEVDFVNKSVKVQGKMLNLSKIELNILMELMKRPEKIFTRDELISLVLGDDFDGFDRTIDAHIKNLRKKIEDTPKNPQYVITVHGIGYKLGTQNIIPDIIKKGDRR